MADDKLNASVDKAIDEMRDYVLSTINISDSLKNIIVMDSHTHDKVHNNIATEVKK